MMNFDVRALEQLTRYVDTSLPTIRARIVDSGGDPNKIAIVAVTKGFGPEAIIAGLRHGLTLFGENYADELVDKHAAVNALLLSGEHADLPRPTFTFQGRLQTNKINRLKDIVTLWQSVDTIERAEALGKRVPNATCLIQVNVTDTDGRSGCLPDEVAELVAAARTSKLNVVGLMTVGPDPEIHGAAASRIAFAAVAELANNLHLPVRSMGMSHDLEDAIACGATMVRLGTALFSARSTDLK